MKITTIDVVTVTPAPNTTWAVSFFDPQTLEVTSLLTVSEKPQVQKKYVTIGTPITHVDEVLDWIADEAWRQGAPDDAVAEVDDSGLFAQVSVTWTEVTV